MAAVSLPTAFDPNREKDKFLARAKRRASKNFRWTSARCLWDATDLAFWLHVFGRDEEALEICRFLSQYEFAGNYDLWTPVEEALALLARLGRNREAVKCVQRIHEAGFVNDRLRGSMLKPDHIQRALKAGDKVLERACRLRVLQELCFMIELGGSKRCPVEVLEEAYQESVAGLRVPVGAGANGARK